MSPRKKKLVDDESKRGTTSMTFRMPQELVDKLDAMKARGYGTSAAMFLIIRAYIGAEAELGPLWWDVEKAAAEERVGVGVIRGRLAKVALYAQQRRR
jgi:hypothetical protein